MAWTFEQARRHWEGLNGRLHNEVKRYAAKVANGAVRRAKSQLGTYQAAVDLVIPGIAGPYEAWETLADSTIERKLRAGYPVPSPLYASGEMRDGIKATEPQDLGFAKVVVKVQSWAEYSSYQEFGTEYMPPRPFLVPAVLRSLDFHTRRPVNITRAVMPRGWQTIEPSDMGE